MTHFINLFQYYRMEETAVRIEKNGRMYVIMQVDGRIISCEMERYPTYNCLMCETDYRTMDSIGYSLKGDYLYLFIAEFATGSEAHSVVEASASSKVLYKDYEGKKDGFVKNTDSLMSFVAANFPNHKDHRHVVLLERK